MRKVIAAIAGAGLLLCGTFHSITAPLNAAEKGKSNSEPKAAETAHAYLGVGVESLHTSLVTQLAELLGDGSGVLVTDIASDSPADKAGLKPDDIITDYNDQMIYSPEQLVKLVRHDKPGREVTLAIIRSGKSQTVKVTLGTLTESSTPRMQHAFRWPLSEFAPSANKDREAEWSSFDSMTLTRVDDKRFKAEIKYRDDKGKIDTQTFEGTREEIRKAILARHDLPANERQHLLNALQFPSHPLEFDFPGVRFVPSSVFYDSNQIEP